MASGDNASRSIEAAQSLGRLEGGVTALTQQCQRHEDDDKRRFSEVYSRLDDVVGMISENSAATQLTNQRLGQVVDLLKDGAVRMDRITSDHSHLKEDVLKLQERVEPLLTERKEESRVKTWMKVVAGLVAAGGTAFGGAKLAESSAEKAPPSAETTKEAPAREGR